MTTAIALCIRFYGFAYNDILEMTLQQFVVMLSKIGHIIKLEGGTSGVTQQRALTGDAANKFLRQTFGTKGKK